MFVQTLINHASTVQNFLAMAVIVEMAAVFYRLFANKISVLMYGPKELVTQTSKLSIAKSVKDLRSAYKENGATTVLLLSGFFMLFIGLFFVMNGLYMLPVVGLAQHTTLPTHYVVLGSVLYATVVGYMSNHKNGWWLAIPDWTLSALLMLLGLAAHISFFTIFLVYTSVIFVKSMIIILMGWYDLKKELETEGLI